MSSLARHKCIAISQHQRKDEMISLGRLGFVPEHIYNQAEAKPHKTVTQKKKQGREK